MGLELFLYPFPDKDPEAIESEQIVVDGSRPSLDPGEVIPFPGHPDIFEKKRDNRQEVP